MIIVVGDYHSANIISQTNVVFDNDVVGISSASGSTPSAFGGQNALENDATIARYGATTFNDIDRKLDSLIDDLKDRDDLDHNAWSDFYGASSGSLNVLFVTGDYYDLNIISQINVLADADLAMQLGSSGFQWLSTGGNSAANEATIVNAGGLYEQNLGGDLYDTRFSSRPISSRKRPGLSRSIQPPSCPSSSHSWIIRRITTARMRWPGTKTPSVTAIPSDTS